MTQPTPVPQIDYTSRDYSSILNDLIGPNGLATQLLPEWTSRNPGDFGVVLSELYAYVGDQLNYYIDRAANESYMDTATQRDSVLRLAKLYGYAPNNNIAAQTTLVFSNTSSTALTVPALTQISTVLDGSSQTTNQAVVTFETDYTITVPPQVSSTPGTTSVNAHQGVTVASEAVSTATKGTPNESFALFQQPVIDSSVSITVNGQPWFYVPRLLNTLPTDQVFTTTTDATGVVTILFGDGSNGSLLPANATVTATYRIGGGVIGNVAANTLLRIVNQIPGNVGQIQVTNPGPAVGGTDAESTDSIRYNASRLLSTGGRATTLGDYSRLAVALSGVAKANAVSAVDSQVTVYVAPSGGGGVTPGTPPVLSLSSAGTTGGFANATTYYYAVTAIYGNGVETAASNIVSFAATPSNLNQVVTLNWTATGTPVGYRVYRSTTASGFQPSGPGAPPLTGVYASPSLLTGSLVPTYFTATTYNDVGPLAATPSVTGAGAAPAPYAASLLQTVQQTQQFLQSLAPANVTVQVLYSSYVAINISVTLHLLPNYSQSVAMTAANAALQALLSYDNVVLGDTITPSDVHVALVGIPGIAYIDIGTLSRADGASTPTQPAFGAVMAVNEVPVIGTIQLTPTGSQVP